MTFAGAMTETVKYYYTAAERIAMRRIPAGSGNGTLYYMFSDHLGSTSVTLNATTGATSTVAFLPFEATRFCGVEPMMTSVGACGYTLNRMAKTGEEVVGEYGPKAPRAASSTADWTSSALRGTWLLEGLK